MNDGYDGDADGRASYDFWCALMAVGGRERFDTIEEWAAAAERHLDERPARPVQLRLGEGA